VSDEIIEQPQPERKKSLKELKVEIERRAMEARAAEEKRLSEEELRAQQKAKRVWAAMWRAYSRNQKNNPAIAESELLEELTRHSSDLVPHYMTAKEFVTIVMDTKSNIKGNPNHPMQEPKDLIEQWFSGEIELSRIPLEKIQ
jgi:hypothetical protein